jgi:hypothetical protein
MATWICRACGQVVGTSGDRPDPIRWSDGHVCRFVREDDEAKLKAIDEARTIR